MPHFKCVACRTRLHTADPIGDLCSECGDLLEPVTSLREIVGFQVIAPGAPSWFDGDRIPIAVAVAVPQPDTTLMTPPRLEPHT